MAIEICTGNPNLDMINQERQLLNRIQLHLMKHIVAQELQLKLYKDLDNQELIDLSEENLAELKADLEQLKNL